MELRTPCHLEEPSLATEVLVWLVHMSETLDLIFSENFASTGLIQLSTHRRARSCTCGRKLRADLFQNTALGFVLRPRVFDGLLCYASVYRTLLKEDEHSASLVQNSSTSCSLSLFLNLAANATGSTAAGTIPFPRTSKQHVFLLTRCLLSFMQGTMPPVKVWRPVRRSRAPQSLLTSTHQPKPCAEGPPWG